MELLKTDLQGLLILQPKVIEDSRGYFYEAYNEKEFSKAGIDVDFVQDNQSCSNYGVVRGLHYQLSPFAQVKLVRVITGKILDVALDIRKGSPTFGKSFSVELSASNKRQLFIPVGFAHGFSVLSEKAEVLYKCDNFYNRESEGGISFSDPALDINWKIPASEMIISEKDRHLPSLAECRNNFVFGE
jgi:dTDP-4-dehydrorhamnose 3,5-epimerase